MTGKQRLDVFCLWYLNKMVIKLAVLLGFKVKNAKKHVKYSMYILYLPKNIFSSACLIFGTESEPPSNLSSVSIQKTPAPTGSAPDLQLCIATLYVTDDAIALLSYFSNIELCNGVIS